MVAKLRRFSMRLRLAAREKQSEAMRQVIDRAYEHHAPTLRLHQVQAKSGACFPLVLGDPAPKTRHS